MHNAQVKCFISSWDVSQCRFTPITIHWRARCKKKRFFNSHKTQHCASVVSALQASTDGDAGRLVAVSADDKLTIPVTKQHDADAQLSKYMALPVSQFVLVRVPLGAELRRIGVDLFELLVPRLELFGVWLQPRVRCTVRSDAEKVDIQSVFLRIEGSDMVQKLQLNERVDFDVHCRFTHTCGEEPAIHCASRVRAFVDPPAPFSFIPDAVLSATASGVVKASLSLLQRTFVPSLASDYGRWANSEAYRKQRRQHAITSDAAMRK